MSGKPPSKLDWRGIGLRALGALGGGVGLAGLGLAYSRIGGT